MVNIRKIAITVSFLATAILVLAQEKVLVLQGKITDQATGAAIPYANLYLQRDGSGTAANGGGEFILKAPSSVLPDTLIISGVGYWSARIPLNVNTQQHNFALRPATIELKAVTVDVQSGLTILKEAIGRIPVNHDTDTLQYTAFYRENVWLGDVELNYTEAILDVYRPFPNDGVPNDELRIVKGRKKQINFGKEAQLYYWISGVSNGARGTLSEDIVKYHHHKTHPFNPASYRYYTYDYVETIREGERNIIVLDILPKKNARKAYLQMRVFLEEGTLAFVRIDFALSEQGIRYVSRKDKGLLHAMMSAIVHVSTTYHKFEYSVQYRKYQSKWYLGSVTRHWEILVDSKKRNWEDRLWRTDIDLVITDIDKGNLQPIGAENIAASERPVFTMIESDFDEAFWENYNVIKPETVDSVRRKDIRLPRDTSTTVANLHYANRENGFTRADTLRGKLTPLRECYDVRFYHLDVAIDMENRSLKGSNLIRFETKAPFKKMQVDLFANIKIDSILYHGERLRYTREFNAVFIDFPETQQVGKHAEMTIFYHGTPKEPNFNIPMDGGVLWDTDSLGNAWAQVVCQGSGASLWWPNKDHLSDEPDSMRISVTVPSQYIEISNGRLISKKPLPGNQTRYDWFVSYPINNYNVTFNIGKYTHYRDYRITHDTLTLDYYVMPYNLTKAKRMFRQVKPMLNVFEKYFGEYPFRRDGFTLVESLYPMEHQSGVCIGKITSDLGLDFNPLLWHESAHEWWGNAVSCRDIADMWIHEAFATYAEILFLEDSLGTDIAMAELTDQMDAVIGKEPVIGDYDVNHIHYNIGDMYSKGSLMLHTFRNVLDDDSLWFSLLRAIQEKYRYQTISSDELITFINQTTKQDFTYFFDQYLRYPELPLLRLRLTDTAKGLEVSYRWESNVPDFRMPVKVTTAPGKFDFIYPTKEWKRVVLEGITSEMFEVDENRYFVKVDVEG